mgnify:CR=1 FL=1
MRCPRVATTEDVAQRVLDVRKYLFALYEKLTREGAQPLFA